jgi:hypothetical protein
VRFEAAVTSISWIPSEAMTGPMRVPMDLGIGHYDPPPPDRVASDDLAGLCAADRFRFANHLSAWVEVQDGEVIEAGYNGEALVGSTTANLGRSVTIPGVGFPVLQSEPVVGDGTARFVQTAGGRTGAPLPRRIDRPPFVRMTAPTAWTTLALTMSADGSATFEFVGASPFPRHWIYGPDGELVGKSGIIDFSEWTRTHDHHRTPWHDYERATLMASVESQVERDLSAVMMSTKPDMVKVTEGDRLITQGEPGSSIYLILDGMLQVDVDGKPVVELGPGAIVGERAILETGRATATVTAMTPVRAARIPAHDLERSDLKEVAATHRLEEIR